MTLKSRSYRVSDETAARLKHHAAKTGRPVQRIFAAAAAFFDPLNDEEHMQFLLDFEKQTSTIRLAKEINSMPPEEQDKLHRLLKTTK